MIRRFGSSIMCLVLSGLFLCCYSANSIAQTGSKNKNLFTQENLLAWCIVPFDNKRRTPAERIDMLKRLKFSQYAYDWRHEHLASFPEEIKLAKENKVFITAVWIWIEADSDAPGKLSADNEKLLEILKESGLLTQLWVGFNDNFFAGGDDQAKVSHGVEMIKYLRQRTKGVATNLGLYNHGNWFGNPENQIRIVKELADPGVGIIYNFHHGHDQIESFASLLAKMQPWLWGVNVNGMKKGGPQILTVGSGDEELEMLRVLQMSGFNGPVGILGHIETEDVEQVLKRNLEGLRMLEKKL